MLHRMESRAGFLAAILKLGFIGWLFLGSIPRTPAIPAFARKYGLRCSACHEAWPKLNNFGQVFKDNGYQLKNDRDAPIYQQLTYWPMSVRIVEVSEARSDWAPDPRHPLPKFSPPQRVPHSITLIGRLFEEGALGRAGIALERAFGVANYSWFAKILLDFAINDIAALPPLFCYNF